MTGSRGDLGALASAGLLLSLSACALLRPTDPATVDSDGDGIRDAFDRCPVDADESVNAAMGDGCPGSGDAAAADPSSRSPEQPDAEVEPVVPAEALAARPAVKLTKKTFEVGVSPYEKSAWGAVLAPGGAGAVFGFKRTILRAGNARRGSIAGPAYAAVFSPDEKLVAVVGRREFVVARATGGKVVRRLPFAPGTNDSPETKAIRFASGDEILFFDGCQLRRTRVSDRKSEAIGEATCGRPLASGRGDVWVVVAGGAQQQDCEPDCSERRTLYRLDPGGGAATELARAGSSDTDLASVSMGSDGRFACYSRGGRRAGLYCVEVASGTELQVHAGVQDGRVAFSPGGVEVAFGGGRLREERPLFIADLGAKTVTRVATLGTGDEWLDFLSPGHLVATGGESVLLVDLADRVWARLELPRAEWEGLVVIPGQASRFVLGRERKTSRDLWQVEIDR